MCLKMNLQIIFVGLMYSFLTDIGVRATPTSTTSAPQPAYHPPEVSPGYVPHATYPYADTYGVGSPYDGYMYPVVPYSGKDNSYATAAQGALSMALKMFAKVGLFLIGGVSLLVVGGLFTTAVCSLTPICTITFSGLRAIDNTSMRSLMTPDKISAAAALVQDAIGKYQRLQRAVSN